jgi:hypothetical protein
MHFSSYTHLPLFFQMHFSKETLFIILFRITCLTGEIMVLNALLDTLVIKTSITFVVWSLYKTSFGNPNLQNVMGTIY